MLKHVGTSIYIDSVFFKFPLLKIGFMPIHINEVRLLPDKLGLVVNR